MAVLVNGACPDLMRVRVRRGMPLLRENSFRFSMRWIVSTVFMLCIVHG